MQDLFQQCRLHNSPIANSGLLRPLTSSQIIVHHFYILDSLPLTESFIPGSFFSLIFAWRNFSKKGVKPTTKVHSGTTVQRILLWGYCTMSRLNWHKPLGFTGPIFRRKVTKVIPNPSGQEVWQSTLTLDLYMRYPRCCGSLFLLLFTCWNPETHTTN